MRRKKRRRNKRPYPASPKGRRKGEVNESLDFTVRGFFLCPCEREYYIFDKAHAWEHPDNVYMKQLIGI
jgi:hypothetical protein